MDLPPGWQSGPEWATGEDCGVVVQSFASPPTDRQLALRDAQDYGMIGLVNDGRPNIYDADGAPPEHRMARKPAGGQDWIEGSEGADHVHFEVLRTRPADGLSVWVRCRGPLAMADKLRAVCLSVRVVD